MQGRTAEAVAVRTLLVLLACVALTGAATVSAREGIEIRVSPNVSMAPATVRVLVTVEPDANNRQLVVEADSGEFYTSSTVQLDGTKAPRTQAFILKELPAGRYDIAAVVVQRNGGERKAASNYIVLQ